jgi:exodeoxyribonuclease V alpha subunit
MSFIGTFLFFTTRSTVERREKMEELTVRFFKETYEGRDDYISALYMVFKPKKSVISCRGTALPRVKGNISYQFTGTWQKDKRGKPFFAVTEWSFQKDANGKESKTSLLYMFSDDCYAGIGTKTVRAMLDKYGDGITKVIEETPADLLSVKGMTKEKLNILVSGYKKQGSIRELTNLLKPIGLQKKQLELINESLGPEAVDTVKTDPFALMDIDGIGFRTCDTIARYFGFGLDSSERVRCGAIEALKNASNNGDTAVESLKVINLTVKKLNDGLEKPVVNQQQVISAISYLIDTKKIMKAPNHHIQSVELYEAECSTAEKIVRMLRLPVWNKDKMVKAVDHYKDCNLSEKQLAAVKKCLTSHVSIITGGAGTGKTTIEKAIIYAYQSCNKEEVTLLAPTGKASRRMSEATGIEAHTIHSRLGLYEGIEGVNLTIDSGLVIVDEFSMVDAKLLYQLITAISPQCQLIMIGDINQLPSVGAGACLKDMIESGVVPTSKLTEIFRQKGGTIVDNSLKIVQQDKDLVFDKQEMLLIPAKDEDEAIAQIKRVYNFYVKKGGIENVALISPLRSSQNGRYRCVSDTLNPILQELINPNNPKVLNCPFKRGDRIMMWKNTDIASNGDVGDVISVVDDEDWGLTMNVHWENGNDGVYHKKDLEKFTLAYSMSVHKSQGSEWDTVIIPVLSLQKCQLFKNNLLYTAITRAKKRVIIIGEMENGVNFMIDHSETYQRCTLFKRRLQEWSSACENGA